MNISSDLVIVNKPVGKIYDFLTDFNNFEKLMPEQVIKWESDAASARFTIKDMAEIGMRIEDVDENKFVLITSDGKVPFEFKLQVNLEKKDEEIWHHPGIRPGHRCTLWPFAATYINSWYHLRLQSFMVIFPGNPLPGGHFRPV